MAYFYTCVPFMLANKPFFAHFVSSRHGKEGVIDE
jgi:hypothetical protein